MKFTPVIYSLFYRCLDEWDVFLDAVNRKEISKELLNFSLNNKDRQFIFISPQVNISLVGNNSLDEHSGTI